MDKNFKSKNVTAQKLAESFLVHMKVIKGCNAVSCKSTKNILIDWLSEIAN